LAKRYDAAGMIEEARQNYQILIKNKNFQQAGRLNVNLANLNFAQNKYLEAIRDYRKAYDQIDPSSNKRMRTAILRNIGHAFVRLGQFKDAIQRYDTVLATLPDVHAAFNLALSYFALGDSDNSLKALQRLIALPYHKNQEETKDETKDDLETKSSEEEDDLDFFLARQKKETHDYILTACRLIAPTLANPEDEMNGYKTIIQVLKQHEQEELASEIEIETALQFLRKKKFDQAIDALKLFERKDERLKAMAATNLSFIYLLENNVNVAEKYADLAYEFDRYNAKALVNKGNCLTMKNQSDLAKQFYLEAIGVEADCAEAIYNLGLINLRTQNWNEALQAFEKLHQIIPNSADVIFQVAYLYEARGQFDLALKWYNILVARLPSDASVLARVGQLCNRIDDEAQAFHFHLESYRHYPASLDIISWLGVWYVKTEMYEKAIHFFTRAAEIQPDEVKWQLMVTSCYRRTGDYQKALALYKKIHALHPENAECLRYLIAICKDLGHQHAEYQAKLARLEPNAGQETPTYQQNPPPQQQDFRSFSSPPPPTINNDKDNSATSNDDLIPSNDDFLDADVTGLLPGS